jgi:hypothetical protein
MLNKSCPDNLKERDYLRNLGLKWEIILTRVRISVTNITGSGLDDWIYWHFYYIYKQLWQLTINDSLWFAPFLTGLRVSSLPLWLFWFWFTNRSLLLLRLPWTTAVLRMNRSSLHGSLYSLSVTVENVCCLAVVTGTCLANHCLSMDFRVCSLLRERVFGEQLASNRLPPWLHYSGFQASCYNNMETGFREICCVHYACLQLAQDWN